MRKIKMILGIILCTGFIFITACGTKTGTSVSDSGSGTSDSSDTNISGTTDLSVMDQYNNLLTNGNSIDDLYAFMEDNTSMATDEELETMVQGVLGYGDNFRDVDYSRLQNLSDRFSDETNSFISIMAEEQGNPSVTDQGIGVSEDVLLERARALENHIDSYPDGMTLNLAYAHYYDLLETVITGQYSSENNVPNYYVGEDNMIGQSTIDHYTDYINNNPDSNTTSVLSEYLELLNRSGGMINSDIEDFYNNLGQRISGNDNTNQNEQNGIGNMQDGTLGGGSTGSNASGGTGSSTGNSTGSSTGSSTGTSQGSSTGSSETTSIQPRNSR